MRRPSWACIAVGLAALAVLGSSASAAPSARQPTARERAAITAALPPWLRQYPRYLKANAFQTPREARFAIGFEW